MKPIHGVLTVALAGALLLAPALAVSAAACMMPSPDESSARPDLPVPGVAVPGSPERDGMAEGEKYVILDPASPGEPPRTVRWNGLDVAPAPHIFVAREQPVVLLAEPALQSAAEIDPVAVQIARSID